MFLTSENRTMMRRHAEFPNNFWNSAKKDEIFWQILFVSGIL